MNRLRHSVGGSSGSVPLSDDSGNRIKSAAQYKAPLRCLECLIHYVHVDDDTDYGICCTVQMLMDGLGGYGYIDVKQN